MERTSHRRASLTGLHLIGVHLIGVHLIDVHFSDVHSRRASLTGVHPRRASYGVHLIGVHLIGVRLKPPSHMGRYCVGWRVVVCYGGPEWFRRMDRLRRRCHH
jgi:hypothetical protein